MTTISEGKKMNWNNLKNMKCPNCGKPITASDHSAACTETEKCGFHMSGGKFKDIVSKLYRPSKRAPDDNLSALNNLGHEKVAEDFSDSPFR